MSIILSFFIGLFGVVACYVGVGMQKEQRNMVGKELNSLNHGMVDSTPVKVGAFGGILIGLAIGIIIGSNF
jgi:hypothetical protein